MTSVFLDTSYVIALETADDQYHNIALNHWQKLTRSLPTLVTTSYIFDEVVTFFNGRNKHHKALEIGNRLISSPSVQFIHVDKALFYEGWYQFKLCSDKSYSLTDCISFVLMKRIGIHTALTFDRHFIQAGFEKSP